jgi:AraC-like DNA-binding protein
MARQPKSRAEILALSDSYTERETVQVPPDYVGYFCPTARPVLALTTDHHAPGRTSPRHSHRCLAFHGCLRGPITLVTDDGEQTLDTGTLFAFSPGVRHHWRNDGSDHSIMLSFLLDADHPGNWPSESGVSEGCRELSARIQGVRRFDVRGDEPLQHAFWQLADCLDPDHRHEALLVTGLVWTLLGRLLERLRSSAAEPDLPTDTAQQIRRFLVQRIQDRLTLGDIARSVHLSPSRTKEVFRAAFGCGVMLYFNQLKIQQAKRLLADRSLTIKQISQRLGFSSTAYFDRVFFRYTGQRPTQFRGA